MRFEIWISMQGVHFVKGFAVDKDGNQKLLKTSYRICGMDALLYLYPEDEPKQVQNYIAWSPFAERLELWHSTVDEIVFHAENMVFIRFGCRGRQVKMEEGQCLTITEEHPGIKDMRLEEVQEAMRERELRNSIRKLLENLKEDTE